MELSEPFESETDLLSQHFDRISMLSPEPYRLLRFAHMPMAVLADHIPQEEHIEWI
jgi:hypothetical protein